MSGRELWWRRGTALDGRRGEAAWVEGDGLVGDAWVLAELRGMDGRTLFEPPVGPDVLVDLSSPSSSYRAVAILLCGQFTERGAVQRAARDMPSDAIG